jgi:hypothetical protein
MPTLEAGLTYQWLRNDSLIASATSSIYEAQVSGEYRVKVTKEGCSQLSAPLKISIAIPLGTEADFGSEQVKIYPNPSHGDFTLFYQHPKMPSYNYLIVSDAPIRLLSTITKFIQKCSAEVCIS